MRVVPDFRPEDVDNEGVRRARGSGGGEEGGDAWEAWLDWYVEGMLSLKEKITKTMPDRS